MNNPASDYMDKMEHQIKDDGRKANVITRAEISTPFHGLTLTRRFGSGQYATSEHKYTPTFSSWCRFHRAIDGKGVKQYIAPYGVQGVYNPVRWYRFMSQDAKSGQVFNYEYVTLEILPDLRLRISLTVKGRMLVDDMEADDAFRGDIETALLEDAICNGWTYDPNDEDARFIMQGSIGDDGQLDVHPGDVGYDWGMYAIAWWHRRAYEYGPVKFDPYYFGDTSLDEQGQL